jgi:hypothetical protein
VLFLCLSLIHWGAKMSQMHVVIYHKIQPDYEKRMRLIALHANYWARHPIPLGLVPLALIPRS